MKIGIVVGSIREGRHGRTVADWILESARTHDGADFEIVDLKEFDVPLYTSETLPMMANKQYDSEGLTRWSRAIDSCDGFVFVTPEYNHGVPGAFKNAVDSLGSEWVGKTVSFVSYGADGGVRCVEQWRQVVANFQMIDVRGQVALSLFTDFGDHGVTPLERRAGEVKTMLDQLVTITAKLRG